MDGERLPGGWMTDVRLVGVCTGRSAPTASWLRLGFPDAPSISDQRRQLRLIADTYGEWTPWQLDAHSADLA